MWRSLARKKPGGMTLVSGELGSGKTHTLQTLLDKRFAKAPASQFLYITPRSRARVMDSIFPHLSSFSNRVEVETPETLAEKLLRTLAPEKMETSQLLRTAQERFALFCTSMDGSAAADVLSLPPSGNNNKSVREMLEYIKILKQCSIVTSSQAGSHNADGRAKCFAQWQKLLADRRLYEVEDLLAEAASAAASTVSLKQAFTNFNPDLPITALIDDFHLFKPCQVDLLVRAVMPIIGECVVCLDPTSADNVSRVGFAGEAGMRMQLERMSTAMAVQPVEFKLSNNNNNDDATTGEHQLHPLPPGGMDSLYSWIQQLPETTRRNHSSDTVVVVCTSTRYMRDQVFELLQSRRGVETTTNVKLTVARERPRLIQAPEIQSILALLRIVVVGMAGGGSSMNASPEWFMVITSVLFTRYRASPLQVKEFGQKLTRQRMEPREILQGLAAAASSSSSSPALALLLQDVDALQQQQKTKTTTLSALCTAMLKLTGVEEQLDAYSDSSARIAALFQVLRRVEFTHATATVAPPSDKVLESLMLVLEQEEEDDGEEEEEEGDEGEEDVSGGGEDDDPFVGQQHHGRRRRRQQQRPRVLVATVQQVCRLFAPKSIDKLCLVMPDSGDNGGGAVDESMSAMVQRVMIARDSRSPVLAAIPWQLVQIEQGMAPVSEEQRQARLAQSLLARAKHPTVFSATSGAAQR